MMARKGGKHSKPSTVGDVGAVGGQVMSAVAVALIVSYVVQSPRVRRGGAPWAAASALYLLTR